ncbi:DNA-binding domain-containing protein [Chitinivorax sp. PXF-14]|uniref:HvfC/BufC N-terminal domain-containing protein n=1 Tax=Chitinivorax sp. PXF-14 TaxID=3230488 RepID=UPI00346565AA
MTLDELEHGFYRHLRGDNDGFAEHIVGTDKVDAPTRLAVYANAYRRRLIEALDSNYPILRQMVGDDGFERIARDYLAAHAPTHFSIRWFGDRLPTFLGEHAGYGADNRLAELAAWEWSMTEAFDAADRPALGVGTMAAVTPEDWAGLQFSFHPSLRRLTLAWNIPTIWKAVTANAEATPPPAMAGQPQPWLIWRNGITSYFRSLDAAEADALDSARAGAGFGEVCEGLCAFVCEDEAPLHAAQYLKTWLTDGLIVALGEA